MKLTETQVTQLQDIDFVEAARKARKESAQLLDDQGFTSLALAISELLVHIVKDPNALIKELKT